MVFANRVRTQPNRFTDFSITRPALESLPIFAEQKVGVDRDLCRAQTQRGNFFRQREVVLDRIACRPETRFILAPSVCSTHRMNASFGTTIDCFCSLILSSVFLPFIFDVVSLLFYLLF